MLPIGEFWSTTILNFCIALGVVLGGALLGGVGAFFTNQPPLYAMLKLADQLKIWALVAALGGTFDTIKSFELHILGGELNRVAQQLIFILSAFFGAHLGTALIQWLIQGDM
ncbi:YtrH family sporulation protein [Salinithrix halophila]|uniref:YtrH family sporulation protein n=1 Tax=Salinithrix halophila TaxID=1485204 RepID=A0ABV8JAJ4_9BACL